MMRRAAGLFLALLLLPAASAAQVPDSAAPVVRAVLFYSPSCPHCGDVINEGLPPLITRYGDRLQIAGVNTGTRGGSELYRAVVDELPVPRSRQGVPALLVGSRLLVGSWEIPNLLPEIVDEGLAGSGIDWPDIPLVRQALAATQQADAADPGEAAEEAATDTAPAEAATDTAPAEAATDTAAAEAATDTAPAGDAEAARPASADSGGAGSGEKAADRPASGAAAAEPSDADRSPEERRPERPASRDGTDEAAASGAGAGEEADPGEAAAAPELTPRDGDGAGAESGGRVESVTRSARDSLLAAAVSRDPSAALHSVSLTDRLMLDPAGNGAAIAVLVLMLIALGLVAADRAGRLRIPASPEWAIPVLSVIGIGVAAYLAYVEVSGVDAICGPVGDCNTVQQSRFARLFGVLPVGVLGVLGYLVLLGLWALARRFEGHRARILTLTWTLALFAVLFSVYLTFLEPFVIGASCAWCLSSAVITTLILLALTPARRAGDGVRPVAEPERAAVSGRRT